MYCTKVEDRQKCLGFWVNFHQGHICGIYTIEIVNFAA